MQHAEAHERLSDLALERGRLARLARDASSESVELRDHLAACERCTADVADWRRTWTELERARPGNGVRPREELGFVRAPASLRARTLAAIAADARMGDRPADTDRAPAVRETVPPLEGRWGRRSMPRLMTMAAIVIAITATGYGWLQVNELQQARAQAGQLETVAVTFERVIGAPKHWAVTLRAADGTAGGTLAWSADEIVVVTTGLPAPGAGQAYRCWVEVDGVRTPLGAMTFSRSTGYWVGSMYALADTIGPGARYGVSMVLDGGQGTPVLIGSL